MIVIYCLNKRHLRHKRHFSSISATFIVTSCVTMIKDDGTVILFSFFRIIYLYSLIHGRQNQKSNHSIN